MATKIKIVKAGKSINSTDPRDYLLHSDYPMLKYHNEYTASVTFNPGDITKTTSVAHNLGYVPAFVSYGKRSNDGANFIIPSIPYGIGEFDYGESWADDTNIYFRVTLFTGYSSRPAGWNQDVYDFSDYYSSFDNLNDHWSAGKTSFGFGGAFRFTGIALTKNQSISAADIEVGVTAKGTGTGDVKMRHYGIDEDNTGDFTSGPMGRSKTTAVVYQNHSPSTPNYNFSFDVKSQVEEIIARAGWSSGNAMGFITEDNGSPDNVWVVARNSFNSLRITKPGTLTVNFRVIVFKDKIA